MPDILQVQNLGVSNGSNVNLLADANQYLFVDVGAVNGTSGAAFPVAPVEKTCQTVCGTATANTSIVTAVSSKRIKVVACKLETAYSAGTISPILTDGNGGTTIYESLLQAISGAISGDAMAIGGPYWLAATTAGSALYLNPAGQNVTYTVVYFADDAA